MNKNLLVTLADKNYLDQAKHFFARAYFYGGWQGDYMLLAHNVPEGDLAWFKEKRILIYRCEPLAKSMPGRWPEVVLSKFYLFTPEFKKWDKIIYGDADLVINASFDKLLQNDSFAPITLNYFKPAPLLDYFDFNSKNFAPKLFLEINSKFDLTQAGFSGTLFCLPTRLITDSSFQYLKSLISVLQFCRFGEELALNLLFFKCWQGIPMVYALEPNKIIKKCRISQEKIKAIAFHFGGDDKPWKLDSDFYNDWQETLVLADKIDLAVRLKAKKVWSSEEILSYQKFLEQKYFYSVVWFKDLLKRFYRRLWQRFRLWLLGW